jgi:hypothetical protein
MSDADEDLGISTFVDPQSKAEVAIIALISEEEFAAAQATIPDLLGYLAYEDWLDRREGFQIGLSMAGITVTTVQIALSPFVAWCRLMETRPTERALDAFAALTSFLSEAEPFAAIALITQAEFERHGASVEAFAPHGGYGEWQLYRDILLDKIVKSGRKVETLPVRVSNFVEWCRCLDQSTSEASLDAYATLSLELLKDTA